MDPKEIKKRLFEFFFISEKVPLFVKIGRFSIPAGPYEQFLPERFKRWLVKRKR